MYALFGVALRILYLCVPLPAALLRSVIASAHLSGLMIIISSQVLSAWVHSAVCPNMPFKRVEHGLHVLHLALAAELHASIGAWLQ